METILWKWKRWRKNQHFVCTGDLFVFFFIFLFYIYWIAVISLNPFHLCVQRKKRKELRKTFISAFVFRNKRENHKIRIFCTTFLYDFYFYLFLKRRFNSKWILVAVHLLDVLNDFSFHNFYFSLLFTRTIWDNKSDEEAKTTMNETENRDLKWEKNEKKSERQIVV